MANGVIRVEKKRTNVYGLIIVFAIIIGAFCFGLYYYIQNPQKVRSFFKKDEVYIEEKTDTKGNVVIGNNELLPVKMENKEIYDDIARQGLDIYVDSVERANNGYTVNLSFIVDGSNGTADIKCLDVLVDGYSTDITFEKHISADGKYYLDFFIKKAVLAELEITRWSKLGIYFYIVYDKDTEYEEVENYYGEVESFSYEKVDNRKKGLIRLNDKDNLYIDFYKLLQDKDYYYFYFLAREKNTNYNHFIQVKKLMINGEIYNYDGDLEVYARYGAMKEFYIKIPRKNYEKIDNFSISFFLISDNSDNFADRIISITNAYSVSV